MNSAGAERPGDVQPVVHQNTATGRNPAEGFADQLRERPSGKVFFAYLDPAYARTRRVLYLFEQGFTPFFRGDRQTLSVRHVAQLHFTGWKPEGHGRKSAGN